MRILTEQDRSGALEVGMICYYPTDDVCVDFVTFQFKVYIKG